MTLTPTRPPDLAPLGPSEPAAAPSSRPRPSALKRWLARLALLGLGLLLPLLLLEAALRVFGPIIPGNYRTGSFQAAHPVYGRFHVPNFDGWVRTAEYVARVKTNSLGLRDDEVVQPKPPGTVRVLVVGDSFVQGSQVTVGEPFTEVLERSLNARPARVEGPARYDVVNAGIGGWGPAEQYLWLKNEGMRLQPDLVVVQLYLGNDISDAGCKITGQDELKHKVCFYLDRDGRLEQDELRPRPPAPFDPLRTPLRQGSLLFNVIETGVFEKVEGDRDQSPITTFRSNMNVYARSLPRRDQQEWDEAWRISAALLGAIQREAAAGGAGFALTAAPSIWQIYPDIWEATVRQNKLKPDQWDLERPNQRLGEIARDLGIPVLDPGLAFKREAASSPARLFYSLDFHFTAAGHRVVARELEQFLGAQGLLP